eukprot:PhM_4_TR15141/c0_g2_i1/m.18554
MATISPRASAAFTSVTHTHGTNNAAADFGVLHFPNEKPRHVAVHPVHPWVVIVRKHNYDISVWNYETCAEVVRFKVSDVDETRREDFELHRAMSGTAAHTTVANLSFTSDGAVESIALPTDGFNVGTMAVSEDAKIGNVNSIAFHDNNTVHWKLPHQANQSSFIAQHAVIGRYVVLCCDCRVSLFAINNPAHQGTDLVPFLLDRQNTKVTFSSLEFLPSGPVAAVACSDGSVRLWNYEARTVSPVRVAGSHNKAITVVKLVAVTAAGEMLLTAGADGALASVTLRGASSSAPKYNVNWHVPKAHSEAIVCVSIQQTSVLSMSGSGAFAVHDLTSGSELRRVLPSRKLVKPVQVVHLPLYGACGDTQQQALILCEHSRVHRLRVPWTSEKSDTATTNLQEWFDLTTSARKKDVHVYSVAVHPLCPLYVFVCTNNGLVQLDMRTLQRVQGDAGFGAMMKMTSVDDKENSANRIAEAAIVTVQNNKVCHVPIDAAAGTSNATSLSIGSGEPVPCSVCPSPSGLFGLFLQSGGARELKLLSLVPSAKIATSTLPSVAASAISVAWHFSEDTFAVLCDRTRRIMILNIALGEGEGEGQYHIRVVCPEVVTFAPPTGVHGGRWLCVQYGGNQDIMQLYRWNGLGSVGGFLPSARGVRWDARGVLCALRYDDRVVVMCAANRSFRMLTTAAAGVQSMAFVESTLFLVTASRICAVVLPSTSAEPDFAPLVEVADADISSVYNSVAANSVVELTLTAPSVAVRPPGVLEIVGMTPGGELIIVDSQRRATRLPVVAANPQLRLLLSSPYSAPTAPHAAGDGAEPTRAAFVGWEKRARAAASRGDVSGVLSSLLLGLRGVDADASSCAVKEVVMSVVAELLAHDKVHEDTNMPAVLALVVQ